MLTRVQPASSSRSISPAGSKPNTWPTKESVASSERTTFSSLAEAVALALERDVRVRDALALEHVDHHLGLRRRHDLVVEALEQRACGRSSCSTKWTGERAR